MTGAVELNHMFLLERTVVGLMRLASRLMRREEISSMVRRFKPVIKYFSAGSHFYLVLFRYYNH